MFMKKIKNKKIYIGLCIVILVIVLFILSGTGVMSKIFSSKAKYAEGSTIEYDTTENDGDAFIDIPSNELTAEGCSTDDICIVITKISCNSDRGKIEYEITNNRKLSDEQYESETGDSTSESETGESTSESGTGESTSDSEPPTLSGYFEIIIGDHHFYGRYVDLGYGDKKTSYIRYVGINLKGTTNYRFNLLGRESISHYIDPIDDISPDEGNGAGEDIGAGGDTEDESDD